MIGNKAIRLFVLLLSTSLTAHIQADTPVGWISTQNTAAYTLDPFSVDLRVSGNFINDTLDVLDFRDDLIGDNDNLAGDTGDLNGQRLDAQFGVTSFLSLFASIGAQDLTVELGNISSATIVDADSELETEWRSLGARWLIYEARSPYATGASTALSLELSAYESDSADFAVSVSEINLPDLLVSFSEPQRFSVNDLNDEGWSAKLIYTTPLGSNSYGSVWGGYGESDAESGTTSSLTSPILQPLFEQQFSLEESYLYFGFGLNWQPRPRLPITVNYEMIDIRKSSFSSTTSAAAAALPGFLRASTSSEDRNHVLTARASWWVTPRINLSLSGRVFSNQFLGVLPHYNNPLSGSFSDEPYGYLGLELGVQF